MKRTPEDDIYAEHFGDRLAEVYRSSKSAGATDQAFAESIGVERSQLRKYLRGEAVPSIRTVALALRHYAISVQYEKVDVAKALGAREPSAKSKSRPMQLRLPFSIEVADPNKFEVELKSLKPRKYEIQIRMKRTG
ncbi:MAG TPA: helix-turn-helix transcriptional regulator [Candidatus Saccharimonadales bacterium]|nr:helix-turn-helix transcriptional regulator [Candidatus Saccharimonadales bacterium]